MDQVIALFAGAGGMSVGFSRAGLKPRFAAEIEVDACKTYARNLAFEPHQCDLSDPNVVENIVNNLSGGSTLAIIGGPPCQGFSTAGSRDGKDPRNRLIFNYLYIVNAIQPRWFLFENVEGILTSNGGQDVFNLIHLFIKSGYNVRIEKVNFASYGLPQSRKRVVIIGNRIGLDFKFPEFTHSFNAGKHKSMLNLPISPNLLEALTGLGDAATIKDEKVPYTDAKPLNEYDRQMRSNFDGPVSLHYSRSSKGERERADILKPGQTMKDLPQELWHDSYRKRAYRRVLDGTPTEKRGGAPSGIKRLHGELNALTITSAATRELIHPFHPRTLTLRECARLQSFPDDFEFSGNDSSRIRQIGNAFPPLAANLFAKHIIYLDGLLGSGLATQAGGKPGLLGYRLTDSIGMSPALRKTEELLKNLSLN